LHRFVRLSFVYAADLDLKRIGQVLEDLSKLRNQADYEPERPGPFASAANVRLAVHAAQTAIDLLDQIDRDPSRRSAAIAALRPPP
jgi:hypothetical protein